MLHNLEREMIIAYKEHDVERFNELYDTRYNVKNATWQCSDPTCPCLGRSESKGGLVSSFERNLRHSKNKAKKENDTN